MKIIHTNSFFNTSTYYDKDKDLYFTELPEKDLSEFYKTDYFSDFYRKKNLRFHLIKKILLRFFFTPPEINALSEYRLLKSHLSKHNNFLEIGSGNGDMLSVVNKKFKKIVSIEMDDAQRKKLTKKFLNVECIGCDFSKTTFSQQFSCVYLRHVLEHVIDFEADVKKISTILTESGVVMVTVPNANNPDILKASIEHHPHTFHFTLNSLTNVFEDVGLKVVLSGTYDITEQSPIKIFLRRLFRINNLHLSESGLGEHLIVIAKKESTSLS